MIQKDYVAKTYRDAEPISRKPINIKNIDTVQFFSARVKHHPAFITNATERSTAIQEWLVLYHTEDVSTTEKKSLQDKIIINLWFLFPTYLSSHYTLHKHLFNDILQQMVISTITAINNFDPSRGFKFPTYLSKYLKQAVVIGIKGDKTIGVPFSPKENSDDVTLVSLPSTYAIHEQDSPDKSAYAPIDTIHLATFDAMHYTQTSMNSETDYAIENSLAKKDILSRLEYLVSAKSPILNERECTVMILRYGLFSAPQLTLEKIADLFHARGWKGTKEWIFQLEKKALKKLKRYFLRNDITDCSDLSG